MISILTFTTAAALVLAVVVSSDPQQTHLVYEQHFLDNQPAPSDTQANPSFQQTPFQPFPQEYAAAPNHYQNPVDPAGYGVNNNNQVPFEQQQQPIPHHMGFPQPQPGHFQPYPYQQPYQQQLPQQQHAIGIPMSQPGMHNQQPPQFMNQPPPFMNQPPPGGFQQQPQLIPVGMSPSEFADRRGPLDNILGGGRPFKRGKKPPRAKIGRGRGPPVKMMEMNRIPKPPKYPLYDMPSIGMATPPPAPLMHPMSHMAASNAYSTFVKPARDGPPHQRRNHQPQNRRRPLPQPQMRQGKRPPPGKQSQRNHRRPPPGKKHFQGGQSGYEHPMASNLDPQVNSPPLGRPLSFDEYMERPSHSFTDDPWNFDPFAAQYNSGMNTYAMKYNYDPLGMNVVDGSQSHLDPNKLSYPGDYFSLQDTSTIMKSPKQTQLGGWDKPVDYRNSITNLLPPALEKNSNRGSPPGHNRHKERFDQRTAESRPNSFNVFDSTPADSQIVKSESLNPTSLLNGGGSSPPIEFSIESSGTGDDHYQNQYNIGQEATPQQWQNFNQPSRHPYQSTYHENPSSHSYREDSDNAQSQNHENYAPKPNEFDNAGPDHYAHERKEDYIPRERPLHDLSDSYNPMGEIDTAMAPPHDDSSTMYRRDGMRNTRQEKTPMVEVEGLSLFRDVLKNANASGARKHLYSALLN